MIEQQSQNSFTEMSPEEAKASLGIATTLMDGLMPKKQMEEPMQAPQNEETAPEVQDEEDDSVQEELAGLKGQLNELIQKVDLALSEDEEYESTEETETPTA